MKIRKKLKIVLAFLLFSFTTSSVTVFAQNNAGFENGLKGWTVAGYVSIDHNNAHKGDANVRIGGDYGTVFQRLSAAPLSIVSFNVYVKASDTTVRAYSFIRFFNVHHKLLLTYKGKAVNSTTYQQTGNYTLTPPDARYQEIGVERDTQAKGFVCVDDLIIETNVGQPEIKHPPLVDPDQYMRPFWKSDTIYNETVLLYSVNGKPAEGKLLYMPDKVLSVQKFDLTSTYKPGSDYVIKDNTIIRNQNSKMVFRADTSFDTKKDLAWFNIQSQWVVVTYTHHDKWDGPVPRFKGNNLPVVMAKLKAKSYLKIAALGMSITRGMDVSSYDTVPPYMPTYMELFSRQLKKAYKYNGIRLYNAGLPGAAVDWGAGYADKYINPLNADLVVIDFGMNDFWRLTPVQFKGYIQTIIQKIRARNPKSEFLLLSNMKFDPDYILDSDKNKPFYLANMEGYARALQELEAEGIVNLDMYTVSDTIFRHKKAKDCIANPLHPNDYMARWYAQGMAQLLIKDL